MCAPLVTQTHNNIKLEHTEYDKPQVFKGQDHPSLKYGRVLAATYQFKAQQHGFQPIYLLPEFSDELHTRILKQRELSHHWLILGPKLR